MRDSHYTPEILSEKLVSYINKSNIVSIADFCVGNGALLIAAQKKWETATFYGSDVSKEVISLLKKTNQKWHLSQCDFIDSRSREKAAIFRKNVFGFDIILLNPPFSCKGGTVHKVELDGESYNVSTSMLFVVESLKYLSKTGSLYAILPTSAAYSQKDRCIWNKLLDDYNLQILEEPEINHFKSCSPSIILASFRSEAKNRALYNQISINHSIEGLSLFRGKVGMHSIRDNKNTGLFLVHSTNLKNNSIRNLSYRIENKNSEFCGPGVLLPRVGLPNPSKICSIISNQKYVISDCIIGIKTNTDEDAQYLLSLLIMNWDSLKLLYKGTGAKYLTLERLSTFLSLNRLHHYSLSALTT